MGMGREGVGSSKVCATGLHSVICHMTHACTCHMTSCTCMYDDMQSHDMYDDMHPHVT